VLIIPGLGFRVPSVPPAHSFGIWQWNGASRYRATRDAMRPPAVDKPHYADIYARHARHAGPVSGNRDESAQAGQLLGRRATDRRPGAWKTPPQPTAAQNRPWAAQRRQHQHYGAGGRGTDAGSASVGQPIRGDRAWIGSSPIKQARDSRVTGCDGRGIGYSDISAVVDLCGYMTGTCESRKWPSLADVYQRTEARNPGPPALRARICGRTAQMS